MPSEERYIKEKLFYENRQALEGETATVYIPFMLDAFEGAHSSSIDTDTDSEIPSSVVLQRGAFTLEVYSLFMQGNDDNFAVNLSVSPNGF